MQGAEPRGSAPSVFFAIDFNSPNTAWGIHFQ